MAPDGVPAFLAVDLFFALSGFVLAFAYGERLGSTLSVAAFMKARWVRLYPLYLVGILLGIVEALLTIHYGQSSIDWSWHKLWIALPFNLLMLPAPASSLFPLNGVMWSIFFELLINLIWAVFYRPLQSNRTLVAVIAFAAVGLALCFWYWNTINGLGQTWTRFIGGLFRVSYSFFLGVLIFRFRERLALPRIHPLALLVALPALLFTPMPKLVQLGVVLFVLPWFIAFGSQVEPKAALASICRALGKASYAVYTVHKRLYLLTYAAVLQILSIDLQPFAPLGGLVFAICLIAGCLLLNRFYDEPARKWLGSFMRRPDRRVLDAEPSTQAP